jgi:acyl-CoA reductase-like NAD-dependent aldehyde dehydrogenase
MSTTATQYKILIGGDFADAASGETMDVIAPATGETIAEVPRYGAEDVDRAVEARGVQDRLASHCFAKPS